MDHTFRTTQNSFHKHIFYHHFINIIEVAVQFEGEMNKKFWFECIIRALMSELDIIFF